MKKNYLFVKNDAGQEEKHNTTITVDKNSIVDRGEGMIEFPGAGLTITDNTMMWSGAKYDIESMDVSQYKGQLTADHDDRIEKMIGRVQGIKKLKTKVVLSRIQFAIQENALAKYAYDMLKSGFLTDFSIETIGPYPSEIDGERVYKDSKLVGLSLVVLGNNKSAHVNSPDFQKAALNSLEQSKKEGLDTTDLEKEIICYNKKESESDINNLHLKNNHMKYVTVYNGKGFAVLVKYNNADGKQVEKNLAPGESVDVSEDQKNAVEAQINAATEKVDIKEIVKSELAPFMEEMKKEMKQAIADNSGKEPEFRVNKETKKDKDAPYDYMEAHAKQIMAFLKKGPSAQKELMEINQLHLEKLQEKGLVKNTITLGDMGNFVISPELLTDIEGHRSNFRPLLNRLNYQDTLSLQMAWLKRSGDIDMQPVEMCDDGEDGNLKPISEYGASIETSNLEELAAVTPVCNAATRFLAADLLNDVAAGYRNDYDRKLAQLFIARLQQAVNANGNTFQYATTSDLNSMKSWVGMVAEITEEIDNGVFILSNASRWEMIKAAIGSGIDGDILGILKSGDLTPLLGGPAIIVPNELLPKLNTAQTRSFLVGGETVTINKAVFYTDLSTFTGRTSGGLQYDLSTEAAYEDGETVKSAFQRNEVVLRGSFFRGGALRDEDKVSALGAPGFS